MSKSLALAAADPEAMVDGEASIATLCAAASSVLPHFLRTEQRRKVAKDDDISYFTAVVNTISVERIDEMFHSIFESLKSICRSANRNVRRMTHESIKEIHRALLETEFQEHNHLATVAVERIFQVIFDEFRNV